MLYMLYALGVCMLLPELYEKQKLLKRARQTSSRMLCNWPNIFLPDMKFSQKHQHVYIQTVREKLISLKDHLSDALWFQRWIRSWSLENTAANAQPWHRPRDWPFLTPLQQVRYRLSPGISKLLFPQSMQVSGPACSQNCGKLTPRGKYVWVKTYVGKAFPAPDYCHSLAFISTEKEIMAELRKLLPSTSNDFKQSLECFRKWSLLILK